MIIFTCLSEFSESDTKSESDAALAYTSICDRTPHALPATLRPLPLIRCFIMLPVSDRAVL